MLCVYYCLGRLQVLIDRGLGEYVEIRTYRRNDELQ